MHVQAGWLSTVQPKRKLTLSAKSTTTTTTSGEKLISDNSQSRKKVWSNEVKGKKLFFQASLPPLSNLYSYVGKWWKVNTYVLGTNIENLTFIWLPHRQGPSEATLFAKPSLIFEKSAWCKILQYDTIAFYNLPFSKLKNQLHISKKPIGFLEKNPLIFCKCIVKNLTIHLFLTTNVRMIHRN